METSNWTADELLRAVQERIIAPDEFLQRLWGLSKGHQREVRRFSPGTVDVFRTRTFDGAERCATVAAVSYPPPHRCVLQRASGAHEQVFYGSAGLPTTLAESRVSAGQHIVVAKWRNSGDLLLQPIGLTDEGGVELVYRRIFTSTTDTLMDMQVMAKGRAHGSDCGASITRDQRTGRPE